MVDESLIDKGLGYRERQKILHPVRDFRRDTLRDYRVVSCLIFDSHQYISILVALEVAAFLNRFFLLTLDDLSVNA
jgi:hypothetical protein